MNFKTPKYFHYFLVCFLLDCIIISGASILLFGGKGLFINLILWLIANFTNYARRLNRRYISYYKSFIQSIKQFVTFLGLFGVVCLLFNGNNQVPNLIEILPILFVLITRTIFIFFLRHYRTAGKGYNSFLVIGETPVMDKIIAHFLSKKSYGYNLTTKLKSCDLKMVEECILKYNLNEIYCSSLHISQNEISKLLALSFKYDVNIHVVSDSPEGSENSVDSFYLEYSNLSVEHYPLIDRKNLVLKRIFDFLFSILVIVFVLSWVTLIVGILIKLSSKGPIFFKQPRAGRNGKYFTCLKFRSMRMNSGVRQAQRNDPRITRIGQFIRKTSIDELPQFINVLFGQMSVVGPRPHIKDLNDKYDHTVNNYNGRNLVKPGITGLSQITGHRGETDGSESMKNRIRVDLLYIRSWTMYLDVFIIYKTVTDIFTNNQDAY